MPQQHHVGYKNSYVNYYLYGSGPKVILAFHGYGDSGNQFNILEQEMGRDYTIIAPDMPLHGHTKWNENDFVMDDLVLILNKILEELPGVQKGVKRNCLQIIPNGTETEECDKFSMLSFSMGGRIVLNLLEKIPRQIERAVLVAPDGLHENFWYWMGTQTFAGNRLFRYTMKQPKWLFFMLRMGEKTTLLHTSLTRIVHYYMDDEQERNKLYKRWMLLRNFRPHLETVKRVSAKYHIPIRFLFGKYDKIIQSKRGDIFRRSPYVKIKIIDASHRLMQRKYLGEIIKLFSE